jgi:hypothetical protein
MRRACLVVASTFGAAVFVIVGWWLAMMGTATPAGASDLCVTTYASAAFYTSIQDAIDAADDGDRIKIYTNTYTETLVITENIILEGGWSQKCTTRLTEDPQFTVIDGGAAGHVVEITDVSTATLASLTLTNGFSDMGGGVYVSGASPTLDKVVVTSNVISPTGTTIVEGAYGAGVLVHDGTITLTDCDITYNTSYAGHSGYCFGGGLALYGTYGEEGRAVIQGTRILSNTNPSNSDLKGGGLFLYPFAQLTFEGTESQVAYNEARAGGGVYMYGNVDLEGASIVENYASQSGGGIFLASGWDGGRIANNYLVDNSATLHGASIAATVVTAEILNNTIVGEFSGSGAGIYIMDTGTGSLELTNNIVVSHVVGIEREGSRSVALSHNDVWNNSTDYDGLSAGSSDISADPGFADPGNDDYHLDSDSPCIDAGTGVDGLYFDYDGDRRTGTLLDIGADEYPAAYLGFVPGVLKSYTP